MDLRPYGRAPTHKTTPLFNALHKLDDIARIYDGLLTETAFCLLNEDHLKLATIYQGLAGVLYSITDDGKMLALIPESLGYTRFDTNMEVTAGGYGPDYGKLIIEW